MWSVRPGGRAKDDFSVSRFLLSGKYNITMRLLRCDEAGNISKMQVFLADFPPVLCKVAALHKGLNGFGLCKVYFATMLSKQAGFLTMINPDQKTGRNNHTYWLSKSSGGQIAAHTSDFRSMNISNC